MHMNKDHGDFKPYQCNQCNGRFISRGSLRQHNLEKHEREINFRCDLCGRGFFNKTHWKDHCRMHQGIKYECNQCDSAFPTKSGLNDHIRSVHDNEKRHYCDVCEKGFYKKTELARHYRIHTGERPFQCQICDSAFARKYGLTVHLMIHSGEKPFECSKCHRRFRQKHNKNRHQERCTKIVVSDE